MLRTVGGLLYDGDEGRRLIGPNDSTVVPFRWLAETFIQYVGHNHNFPQYTTDTETKIIANSDREFWWKYGWILSNRFGFNCLRTSGGSYWGTEQMLDWYEHDRAGFMAYLQDMFDMAWANGIYIIFCFVGGFYDAAIDPATTDHIFVAGSPTYNRILAWIGDVMNAFKDHPGVGAWDICNEPDSQPAYNYWVAKNSSNPRIPYEAWSNRFMDDCIALNHSHIMTMGVGTGSNLIQWGEANWKVANPNHADVWHAHRYFSVEDGYLVADPHRWAANEAKHMLIGEVNKNTTAPPWTLQYWAWFDGLAEEYGDSCIWMQLDAHPLYPVPQSYMNSIPPMPDVVPPKSSGSPLPWFMLIGAGAMLGIGLIKK